jgi:acetolactate decarboxylase
MIRNATSILGTASILIVGLAFNGGCDRSVQFPVANRPPATPPDQLTQVSIINALMLGQYDGVIPLTSLLGYGDFGLGTCDHLDGELIVLDGAAFQVRSDGTIHRVSPEEKIPFAVVTPFQPDGKFDCPAAHSLEELDALLDKQLPGQNLFVAIRIDAQLRSIRLRSVPRQEPPYSPLADVAKTQTTWTRNDVEGTLIGIRSPPWVTSLNVPGYHWHFLSTDRRVGGHVIDCQIKTGQVSYDTCDSWLIKLSESAEFQQENLSRNLNKELEEVERSRGK